MIYGDRITKKNLDCFMFICNAYIKYILNIIILKSYLHEILQNYFDKYQQSSKLGDKSVIPSEIISCANRI